MRTGIRRLCSRVRNMPRLLGYNSGRPPGRPRALLARLSILAVALLLASVAVVLLVTSVAVEEEKPAATLVSNADQPTKVGPGYETGTVGAFELSRAQQFTTGDNENGYTLSTVETDIRQFGGSDTARVGIYSSNPDGTPATGPYTLTNSSSIAGDGLHAFAAPANSTLDKETNNQVVIEDPTGHFKAESTNVDGGKTHIASDRSIKNNHFRRLSASSGGGTFAAKLRESIEGSVDTPAANTAAESTERPALAKHRLRNEAGGSGPGSKDTRIPIDASPGIASPTADTSNLVQLQWQNPDGGGVWWWSGFANALANAAPKSRRATATPRQVETPVVTIEADSTSAIYREDSADFTLTRTGATNDTLTVTVNLTQDQSYLTAANLSRTVTFAQDSATAALQVPATQFMQLSSGTVAEKGTLTATVADGTGYNVGTANSAEVDIVIAATIRISESSYTISEEGSTLTATVVVRTGEGAPQPAATITVALGTFATGSAMSPEDYDATSRFLNFLSSDFTANGTVYEAEKSIDITIYDDLIDENDETFDIRLQAAPGLHIKYWGNFVNSAGQRCYPTCSVTATITDSDPVVANITGVEITSSPAQHDSYSAGETVTVAATFDEAVEVDTTNGTPTLDIEVGSEMRSAAYTETSADGTTVSFSYTVVGSDHDENGIDVPAGTIELNGGTITRQGTSDAALLSHGRYESYLGTHRANKDPEIVSGGVTVASTPSGAADTYGAGEMITFQVEFDFPVSVDTTGGTPRLLFRLGNPGSARNEYLHYVRGSGSKVLVFEYVVQSADEDNNGIFVDSDKLQTNSGAIKHTTTDRDADLDHARPGNNGNFPGHKVDGSLMPSIAQLTGLTLSGVSLTPAFASGTTAYTATVGNGVEVTTVAATAETGATATVLPADSDTDTTGHQVALQVGSNDITVTVTKAGASTRTYTVVVTREPPDAVAAPGISLCEARLSETEPVWRQAEVDICWNVGSAFRKDSDVVFEWQRRFFWGDDVTNSNPWSPWREFARGDTYTQCGDSCVRHTLEELFRGYPFTYRMRIRIPGASNVESEELEAQAPNSNATGLVPEISGAFLPGTVEYVAVPTGTFWFDLVFGDSDSFVKVLMVETVQGLEAADLVVTNATATVEPFDHAYKVTLTPVTLGQPVTAHLPANTVKGVGEGITGSGGNNYTRDNVASNTMTWETALPGNNRATESPSEPLTAAFEDVPTSHDGESPFTFRIAFSEDIKATRKDLRDHGIVVDGGTATNARRVDKRKDLWEITVEPSGTGSVSILVHANLACTEAGAICTADGRMLSEGLGRSISGPPSNGLRSVSEQAPLTAAFQSVPSEHDGSKAFTFRLAFSAPVKISFRTLRDVALSASGGMVLKSKRVDGRSGLWKVKVRPSGNGPVTVTLSATAPCGQAGAVCTADGRALSNSPSATIQGPPALSVADAEVEEGLDAALAFAVTLNRAPSGTVTVDYATADGTAVAGADYTSTSGTLTFAAGETSKTVSVAVLDDVHDEGSETFTLRLSNASGAYIEDGVATGTISNSDPLPQAWIARFSRTVADQVVDAVGDRLRGQGRASMQVRLAGEAIVLGSAPNGAAVREADVEELADWLDSEAKADRAGQRESRAVTGRDILTGTAYEVTGGNDETGFGSLWGRGTVSRFDGREGTLSLDGEVSSGVLGADWIRGRGMAGLAVAHSRGQGGYRSPEGNGSVSATLTGVYPYGRYKVNERLVVSGMAGYGEGALTLTPQGQSPMKADMDLAMAAADVSFELARLPELGGLELVARSDALAVRTTSEALPGKIAASKAEVTRLRAGLEGSRPFRFKAGAELTPSVEIGLRHDGGDAETGFGVDIDVGVALLDPRWGLQAELRARGLLTHEADGFQDRGFSGSLAWKPDPAPGLGPRLTLGQTVGSPAAGGMGALQRPDTARAVANDNGSNLGRHLFEAKFGYGLAMFENRITGTPEAGVSLSEEVREVSLSMQLEPARPDEFVSGNLTLEAVRRMSANDDYEPEDRVSVGLSMRW